MSNDNMDEKNNHSKTNTKTKTNSFLMQISNSDSKLMMDFILSDNNQYSNFNNNDNNNNYNEENKMDIDVDDDIENNIKQANEMKNCYIENKMDVEEWSSGLPGTFLGNEIMSKKMLNLFQNISSIFDDKIRISSQKQNKNSLSKTPKLSDFRVLCSALIIAHNDNTEMKSKITNNNAENEDEEKKNQSTHITSTMNEIEKNDKQSNTFNTHQLELQLQHALDDLNMSDVAAAVALGATVEHTHIRQSALHFGDEYVPIFCMLLSYGELYIADR